MMGQYGGNSMSYVERLRRMRQMQMQRQMAMRNQRAQQGIGSPQGLGGLRPQPAPNQMGYQNANPNAAFNRPQQPVQQPMGGPAGQPMGGPTGNTGGAQIPPMGGNPYSPTMGQGWNLQNMIKRNRQNYGY